MDGPTNCLAATWATAHTAKCAGLFRPRIRHIAMQIGLSHVPICLLSNAFLFLILTHRILASIFSMILQQLLFVGLEMHPFRQIRVRATNVVHASRPKELELFDSFNPL